MSDQMEPTMQPNASQAGVGTAHLSEANEDDDFVTIHGVAIGAGDVTYGKSEIKKKWPGEELKKAAETLEGSPLVRDHENNTDGTVGEVTKATYREGVGVLYEAKIASHYEELIEDVKSGLLDVSPRAYHAHVEDLDENDDGALVVENVVFNNLSVVSSGASPSNTLEAGEAVAMAEGAAGESVAVLERSVDVEVDDFDDAFDRSDELRHGRECIGDLVSWGDQVGIVTGVMVEDDVEKYQIRHASVDDDETLSMMDETSTVISESTEKVYDHRMRKMANDEDEEMESEIDEDSTEELQDLSTHQPEFSGTVDQEWSEPSMSEFTDADSWADLSEDEQSSIADHYLVSKSGFPPENFGDLALPVVETDGQLNLNALSNAKARAGQVSGLSGDTLSEVESMVDSLANENFEDASFGEDEEDMSSADPVDVDVATLGDDPATSDVASNGVAHSGNESHTHTMTQINYNQASDEDLESMDDPVVLERDDVESLRNKAEQADTVDEELEDVNSTLEDLADAREELEQIDDDVLESVKDAEDPVVIEAEDHEELQSLVGDVSDIFAEELAEYTPFEAEELSSKWSPTELRDKVETHEEASVAELNDANSDPEPEGGSKPSEEELADEDPDGEDVEELAREKVARQLEADNMSRQAEKVREGDIGLDELGVDIE